MKVLAAFCSTAGTYPITIRAEGGGLQAQGTLNLTIQTPGGGGTLTVPNSITAVGERSNTVMVGIPVRATNAGTVTASVTEAVSGITFGSASQSVPAGQLRVIYIPVSIGSGAALGNTAPISVTIASGGSVATTTMVPQVLQNDGIDVDPATQSVAISPVGPAYDFAVTTRFPGQPASVIDQIHLSLASSHLWQGFDCHAIATTTADNRQGDARPFYLADDWAIGGRTATMPTSTGVR